MESSQLQTDGPTSTLGSETHISNSFNEFVKRNYGGMTRDLSNPIHFHCRLGGTSRKHARGQGGALLSGEERACRISQGSKATFSRQVQS